MKDIHFTWRGKTYGVKANAVNKDYIVLPNRRVIQPLGWLEDPVCFIVAIEKEHPLEHASIGEIAEHMGNAILAHEVE